MAAVARPTASCLSDHAINRARTYLPHVPQRERALLLLVVRRQVEDVGVLRVVPVRGDEVPESYRAGCG